MKTPIITLVCTVITALVLWVGATLIDHGQRIGAEEVRQAIFEKWLEKIEGKLDSALNR